MGPPRRATPPPPPVARPRGRPRRAAAGWYEAARNWLIEAGGRRRAGEACDTEMAVYEQMARQQVAAQSGGMAAVERGAACNAAEGLPGTIGGTSKRQRDELRAPGDTARAAGIREIHVAVARLGLHDEQAARTEALAVSFWLRYVKAYYETVTDPCMRRYNAKVIAILRVVLAKLGHPEPRIRLYRRLSTEPGVAYKSHSAALRATVTVQNNIKEIIQLPVIDDAQCVRYFVTQICDAFRVRPEVAAGAAALAEPVARTRARHQYEGTNDMRNTAAGAAASVVHSALRLARECLSPFQRARVRVPPDEAIQAALARHMDVAVASVSHTVVAQAVCVKGVNWNRLRRRHPIKCRGFFHQLCVLP